MKAVFTDLTGQIFNQLTILGFARHQPGKGNIWSCLCKCGVEVEYREANIKSGKAKSCGCRSQRYEKTPPICKVCDQTSDRISVHGNYFRTCTSCWHKQVNGYRTSEQIMLCQAKMRAAKTNVPFSITAADIFIPEYCPILGVRMERGSFEERETSPSLDRMVPELGYVPGNIAVISYRANRIKNDATAEEHRKIANWMESQLSQVSEAA